MIHFIPVTQNNVTFCEKKSGGLCFAQHPVSRIGLIVRLTDTLERNKHVTCDVSWLGQFDCIEAVPQVGSPTDVLLAHHTILPNERLLTQAEKNVDQSQHTCRSYFGPWEILHKTPEKIRKASWKVKTLHFFSDFVTSGSCIPNA